MNRHLKQIGTVGQGIINWCALPLLLGAFMGCGSLAVSSDLAEEGIVVSPSGHILDFQKPEVIPLGPLVQSIIGYAESEPYFSPRIESWLHGALPSPNGRFVALLHRNNRDVCIVDLRSRKAMTVERIDKDRDVYLGGWNPDGDRLLCLGRTTTLVGDAAEDRHRGHLFVLEHGEKGWSWQKLAEAGEVSVKRGREPLTGSCWTDNDAIVFTNGGRITRYDLREKRSIVGPEGHSAYSCGKDKLLFRLADQSTFFFPFVMTTWHSRRPTGPVVEMWGNGVVMNGRPIVSPNGEKIVFVSKEMVSVFGHAGIRPRLCTYDLESGQFKTVFERRKHADMIHAAGSGVWINDRYGLARAARGAASER